MQTELDAYRQTVLDLCLRLPDTPRRPAGMTCVWCASSGNVRFPFES